MALFLLLVVLVAAIAIASFLVLGFRIYEVGVSQYVLI
jgi:hypothetical protein